MNTARFNELREGETRMAACGCGGACRSCQNEPRPVSDDEIEEFEQELAAAR